MPGQTRTRLESQIERQAVNWIAKELGVTSVKFTTMGSDTGYPDRIFWVPGGKPVLIEFKRPGGKVSAKQAYHIERLKSLGYNVEICTSATQAFAEVQKAMDTA